MNLFDLDSISTWLEWLRQGLYGGIAPVHVFVPIISEARTTPMFRFHPFLYNPLKSLRMSSLKGAGRLRNQIIGR